MIENKDQEINDLNNTITNLDEQIENRDQEINDLNNRITNLDNVVATGSELIKGLEAKLIESNQLNQTIKKEMQVLIYQVQIAQVQLDKKNQTIGLIGIIGTSILVLIIAKLLIF